MRTIPTGETGWFASPGLVDLDGDRRLEIVAPSYRTSVFDARGRRLGTGSATAGRVYGLDVYRVPRSRPNLLPWPTGRGHLLRDGTPR